YKIDSTLNIAPAAPDEFKQTVLANSVYFQRFHDNVDSIPHAYYLKPAALEFLPNWIFAYHYPNNVNRVGVPIPGCDEMYCNRLLIPVFPTPLYETLACTLLFFILWYFRKRIKIVGTLFALYLILNGFERFMIEKIRVNNKMNFLGFQPTQAEVISSGLMLVGALLWLFLWQKNRTTLKKV
ncbi:MAG TPA: prolipoprotein diacylglyceryl transferase family protein, partial [Flavisolibacter sp.]|nr:prolipoprotein diacylglyceryl transferase family protein [Flavisolibacter sp.]